MKFDLALNHVFDGKKVVRTDQTYVQFIFEVRGSTFNVNRAPLNIIFEPGTLISYHPHIDCCLADGTIAVYTPTQIDIYSDKWELVD